MNLWWKCFVQDPCIVILKNCYLLCIRRQNVRCFDEKFKEQYQKRVSDGTQNMSDISSKMYFLNVWKYIGIFYHLSNGSNYFSSSIKLKYNAHLRVFVTKCCSFGTHKEPYCKWAIFSTTACCQDHTTTSTTSTTHTWCL